nr:recombinase family protein [Glycomyces arizonensis]
MLYLRVSDPKQVNTDYDPEGNSIPAQRKACTELAGQLGLTVVEEYVEPGRSAKTIDRRPRFNAMMERVRERGDVDAIVIYMRSRIFRNAADAAMTRRDLKQLGVSLLSVKDPTADSISGDMLAGILDVVNEYQSRAAGDDIAYKMEAKAQRGGTPNRARLGYLNTTESVEGRPVRTVVPDPERAPLVRMLFEHYATPDSTPSSNSARPSPPPGCAPGRRSATRPDANCRSTPSARSSRTATTSASSPIKDAYTTAATSRS